MKKSTQGVIFLLINAFSISSASLLFVTSGREPAQIITWVGLFGAPLSLTLLSTEKSFNPVKLCKMKQFYLSILSASLFGSIAIGFHFWSLEFILPSDNNMVGVFFSLFTSVILQSFEDRKRPTLLTIVSVFFGFIGTVVICDPRTLFTDRILDFRTIKGVTICAISGTCFACLYSNIRRFPKMPPEWTCLWLMVGNISFGMISYRPLAADYQTCSKLAMILSAGSSILQALASIFGLKGTMHTTVTALSVIQLLAPVFSFFVQIFILPEGVSWTSAVGIIFVVLAVLTQLKVLRRREEIMIKEKLSFELQQINSRN